MQYISLRYAVVAFTWCFAEGLRLSGNRSDNVKANGGIVKPKTRIGTQHLGDKPTQFHLEQKYKKEEAIRKGLTDYQSVVQRGFEKPAIPQCQVLSWAKSLSNKWKCATRCNEGCSPQIPWRNERYAYTHDYEDEQGFKRTKRQTATCKSRCCPPLSLTDGISSFDYKGEGSEHCVAP